MLKEFAQYLVGLGNTKVEEVNGQAYSTQKLNLVEQATPNYLEVKSLSGLVQYLKSEFDKDKFEKRMVHVVSPTEVTAFSTYNNDYQRNNYMRATAMVPKFEFDRWFDAEQMNIKLQSAFVQNEDRNIMLQVVGNIREESVNTIGDDGVSQAVTAKIGVATVAQVQVPNPVVLKPYRTFIEVLQPESEFIFRMKSGPSCALFEADGGAWKLEAMNNVKKYLENELQEEIQSGKVIVIA